MVTATQAVRIALSFMNNMYWNYRVMGYVVRVNASHVSRYGGVYYVTVNVALSNPVLAGARRVVHRVEVDADSGQVVAFY
ncbi:hypothetical protein [Caldivirga sp.]|uniref:hypothetical protein n=1 Tax=Caldivirga sp. TaxID=2080243 RepID=UPI0025BA9366|nr:hypothetical protein [Caldivirga sp.]